MNREISLNRVLLALLILVSLSKVVTAQSKVSKNCDLNVFGRSDSDVFQSFDKDLRGALKTGDVGKVSLLLKYPFRVNDALGSYFLHDAAGLSGRFERIFTAAVRNAVLNSRPETVWCTYAGIAYGNGVVWVNPKGQSYAIETVNVPDHQKPSYAGVAFACDAEKHRVIVDHGPDGKFRYRAWNKPRLLLDKPDLEISDGKQTFEGSGPCAYAIWQFRSGSAEFKIEETGHCDPDVPNGASGRLIVSMPEKADVAWWCR